MRRPVTASRRAVVCGGEGEEYRRREMAYSVAETGVVIGGSSR